MQAETETVSRLSLDDILTQKVRSYSNCEGVFRILFVSGILYNLHSSKEVKLVPSYNSTARACEIDIPIAILIISCLGEMSFRQLRTLWILGFVARHIRIKLGYILCQMQSTWLVLVEPVQPTLTTFLYFISCHTVTRKFALFLHSFIWLSQ